MRAARWIAIAMAPALTHCLVSFEDYPVLSDAAASGFGGTGARDASAGSGGNGASGGGLGGSAGSSGAAGNSSCSDGHLELVDDFNDGALSSSTYSETETGGMAVLELGGELSISFPANTLVQSFGGIRTVAVFDLTSCGAFVRVTDLPTGQNIYTVFGISGDDDRYFDYAIIDQVLYARIYLNQALDFVADLAFDPIEHAWLRLSELGGSLLWETSVDGKSWKHFASLASTFDVSGVRIYLGAGTQTQALLAGTTAGFDDLNVVPPGSG